MKRIYFVTICSLIFSISCSVNQKDFSIYRSFDEYKVSGVDSVVLQSAPLKQNYVMIKQASDTVFVNFQYTNCPKKYTTYYLKRSDYYYHFRKEILDRKEVPGFDTSTEYFFEKFIFNDTILTFQYSKFKEEVSVSSVIVDTKDRQLIYGIDTFLKPSRNYNLDFLKGLVKNEEDFYDLEKVIKGDTLFTYRKTFSSAYKQASLYQVHLLEGNGLLSFYEFCYPISIISKFYDKNGKTPIVDVDVLKKIRSNR